MVVTLGGCVSFGCCGSGGIIVVAVLVMVVVALPIVVVSGGSDCCPKYIYIYLHDIYVHVFMTYR